MALFAKLWTDVIDDPKLMRADRMGARNLDLLPWLIVFAKRAEDDGRLTIDGVAADSDDIARGIPCVTRARVAKSVPGTGEDRGTCS